MHATTRLLGEWRATFHTSIASEFRDEACDCRTPLFFICGSLTLKKEYQKEYQEKQDFSSWLDLHIRLKENQPNLFFVKLKLTKMNSSVSKLPSDTELSMLWIKFDFHIHVDFFMELPRSRSIHAENIFWLSIWCDHAWCEFPSSLIKDEDWITETCNNWQNKKITWNGRKTRNGEIDLKQGRWAVLHQHIFTLFIIVLHN